MCKTNDFICVGPSTELLIGDNITFNVSCNLRTHGFMGTGLYLAHYVITKTVHSTPKPVVQEILVDQLSGWNCM